MPIDINNSDVSEITIDGQIVQEVTANGSVVFRFVSKLIEDDFNDNSFDTTKWTDVSPSGGAVAEQNQRLELISPGGGNKDRPYVITNDQIVASNQSINIKCDWLDISSSNDFPQMRTIIWWDGSTLGGTYNTPKNILFVRNDQGGLEYVDSNGNITNLLSWSDERDSASYEMIVNGDPSNFSATIYKNGSLIASGSGFSIGISNVKYSGFFGREGSGRKSAVDNVIIKRP